MGSISRRFNRCRKASCGFTYVGLLIAIALAGVALAGAGTLWSTHAQREREADLLFIGDQFQRAITAYHDQGPAGVRQFPAKLEDLLQDRRFPVTRRYLRKVFADPMTGNREWGLVRGPGGGITGVFSTSSAAPIKRTEFPAQYKQFEAAKSYSEWRFVYGHANLIIRLPQDALLGAEKMPALLVTPGAGSPERPGARLY